MTPPPDGNDWTGRTALLRRPPIAEINTLAAERRAAGEALVDLGQAVLGLPPPPAAVAAIRDYLAHTAIHLYSPDPGLPEARKAVANWAESQKGIRGARADEVMLTCGANQAFVNAILTLTHPGDEVITFGPGYFDHDFAIRLAGCDNVELPLPFDGQRFGFDVAAFEAAIGPRTRAVVLVSPGNPTGMLIPPRAVDAVVEICQARGLWLISDEVYDQLVFAPEEHSSPATRWRERVLVLGSFSKIFALAAWRCGYLLGPAAVVEEAIKAQDALVVCAPVPAQRAAMGAIDAAATYLPGALSELTVRREHLFETLQAWPAVAPVMPQGATFVFARLTGGGDDVDFCRQLVTERGVVAVPGSAFGAHGAGWVRFSFGNQPLDQLELARQRLR